MNRQIAQVEAIATRAAREFAGRGIALVLGLALALLIGLLISSDHGAGLVRAMT